MASTALYGLAWRSPFASIPHSRQVAGMNCVQPTAPALDGPMLQPSPDSIWVIAARIFQFRWNAFAAERHVERSGPAPEHGRAVCRPVFTLGAWPIEAFEARARPSIGPNGRTTGGSRKDRTSTHFAGWPRREDACSHERCRWLPRPCPASPL